MNEIAFLDLNEISLQSLSPMLSMMVFALFILIVGAIKKDLFWRVQGEKFGFKRSKF